MRTAIVAFVPSGNEHLLKQAAFLLSSVVHVGDPDTDLVLCAPNDVLCRFAPVDRLVRVTCPSVSELDVWRGYGYINSIACLLEPRVRDVLAGYGRVLRSDVDCFLTPLWPSFVAGLGAEEFVCGVGHYCGVGVRERIVEVAARLGYTHRGLHNLGSTWLGPVEAMLDVARETCVVVAELLNVDFAASEGEWPGWYRGVCSMYGGEIALNHCVAPVVRGDALDADSASSAPVTSCAHVHCWHTNNKFSKFYWNDGKYVESDFAGLDMGVVRDYCMGMAVRSRALLLSAAV